MKVGRNVNKQIDLLHQIWPKEKADVQDVYSEACFLRIMVRTTNKFKVVLLMGKGVNFLAFSNQKVQKNQVSQPILQVIFQPRSFCQRK